MKEIIRNIAGAGLAVGQMVIDDAVSKIRLGIESFDDRPVGPAFGDLSDVTDDSANGICIDGVHSLRPQFSNVALFAATGVGKSTTAMLGQLLRVNGPTIFVFDPSATLFALTAHRLARLGYQIHNIDYSNILNSSGLNFIDCLKNDEDASRFAAHLVRGSLGGSKSDPFFNVSASSLLAFLFKLILRMDKKYRNMANMMHLLQAFSTKKKQQEGTPQGTKLDRLASRLCTDAMWSEYMGMVSNQSEKTLGSILLTCKVALEYFSSDALCRVTATGTVDFDSLRDRKQIIYISANAYDSAYYKTLTSTTIELAMRSLMREVKPDTRKVFFLLDECAICDLPSLSEVVSNTRKFNIYNLLCYQSQAQLFHAYGKDLAQNILGNCSKLYYGYQDMNTSRDLSEMIGKRTIVGRDGKRRTEYLMSADEIVRMPKNEGLLLCRNVPYKLELRPWFRQPLLKLQAQGGPYIFQNDSILSSVPLIGLA
jgi:type IV secretory pathway TraG/TraD family ATPase VirD4